MLFNRPFDHVFMGETLLQGQHMGQKYMYVSLRLAKTNGYILDFNNLFISSQVRVNKEQDHVLISPQGLSFAEVTGANLVSTTALCVSSFSSHVFGLHRQGNLQPAFGKHFERNFTILGEMPIELIVNLLKI